MPAPQTRYLQRATQGAEVEEREREQMHSMVPRSVLMSTACEAARLIALHDVSAWPAVQMRRLAVMLSCAVRCVRRCT